MNHIQEIRRKDRQQGCNVGTIILPQQASEIPVNISGNFTLKEIIFNQITNTRILRNNCITYRERMENDFIRYLCSYLRGRNNCIQIRQLYPVFLTIIKHGEFVSILDEGFNLIRLMSCFT